MNNVYLGDGVYAHFHGADLCLTTENGVEVTNTIWLEPVVLVALQDFLARATLREKEND